jgi:cytochrome o ubiquinol oxidase operon protein cyoD
VSPASIDSAGASGGSIKAYATGFVLAIVLTAIPFGLVIYDTLPRPAVITVIIAAAVMQVLVHLHYFLHVNSSSKARWNVLALLFTALIMTLIVGGSIWIMLHLDYRLM